MRQRACVRACVCACAPRRRGSGIGPAHAPAEGKMRRHANKQARKQGNAVPTLGTCRSLECAKCRRLYVAHSKLFIAYCPVHTYTTLTVWLLYDVRGCGAGGTFLPNALTHAPPSVNICHGKASSTCALSLLSLAPSLPHSLAPLPSPPLPSPPLHSTHLISSLPWQQRRLRKRSTTSRMANICV